MMGLGSRKRGCCMAREEEQLSEVLDPHPSPRGRVDYMASSLREPLNDEDAQPSRSIWGLGAGNLSRIGSEKCGSKPIAKRRKQPLNEDDAQPSKKRKILGFGAGNSNRIRLEVCGSKPRGKVVSKPQRDNDVHRFLFLPNGIADKTSLAYCVKEQIILKGYKQGNGIVCSCCNTEISPSKFEAYAGFAARRQPYRHIYTCDGLTLHDLAISLAKGQNPVSISGPKTPNSASPISIGKNPISAAKPPISASPIPIGQNCEPEPEGIVAESPGDEICDPDVDQLSTCGICKNHDFSHDADRFDDRSDIICHQCCNEFHAGCLRQCGLSDLKQLPKPKWCCNDCDQINAVLKILASNGPHKLPASPKRRIKKQNHGDLVQWQIIKGKNPSRQHRSLLSRVVALFGKCFDPIVTDSGCDLITVMTYGERAPEQEFRGMHCLVLTVNSALVSAGLFRIFGRELAELPIVATSKQHQGKGYFQALFSFMETILDSLGVKNLVLPAAEHAEPMWTNKFGFQKMSDQRLLDYPRYLELTSFRGTSMLEKPMIV